MREATAAIWRALVPEVALGIRSNPSQLLNTCAMLHYMHAPLIRYQYDPNPRVREAMAAIWRALVPEPRAAVEAHWDAIARELLGEVGGRLWRNREAACLGLADLLQVCLGCILKAVVDSLIIWRAVIWSLMIWSYMEPHNMESSHTEPHRVHLQD